MGGKKQTQTQTYAYQTPPKTQEIKNYESWKPQIDPGIAWQVGQAKNDLHNSFNNPQGAYTTPAIRDAIERTGGENLNQMQGELYREGQADVNRQEGAKLAGVAGLTQPQLVQTGGTMQQSGGVLNSIIQGASAAGSMALM